MWKRDKQAQSNDKVEPRLSTSQTAVEIQKKPGFFGNFRLSRTLPAAFRRSSGTDRNAFFFPSIEDPEDPSTSNQNKRHAALRRSGISLPDESILIGSAPFFASPRGSPLASEIKPPVPPLLTDEELEARDMLKQKIIKITELISKERTVQEENIAEYRKIIGNADKQQAARIKTVFEKKNQKSLSNIDKLQRKLESYQRRIKDLETNFDKSAVSEKSETENEDSVTITSQTVANPLDVSSDLPENSEANKNILNHAVERLSSASFELPALNFGSSFEDWSRLFSAVSTDGLTMQANPSTVSNSSRHLQIISSYLLSIKNEIESIRETQTHIEEHYGGQVDDMENTLLRQLDEDGIRREEQLNDLADSQQREITLLKQELKSLEDKMEYHANEQARDTQELLESCQNRIAKIELQQQQTGEAQDAAGNPRAVMGKLMNLLLAILALVFVVLSTISGLVKPFVKTWVHLVASITAIVIGVTLYNNYYEIAKLFRR